MARSLGEINASSMADIAFLLLIFFLVTTTMDVDTGLTRLLPPMPEDEDTEQDVRQRNIFTVLINQSDRLLIDGEPADITMLKDRTKEFIQNVDNDPNLPEKEVIEVEYFGEIERSKGVVSLQNHRGTSYMMYMQVQDELVAAYNELRDEVARNRFGQPFEKLEESKQDAVQRIYPRRISEAEPRSGGRTQ